MTASSTPKTRVRPAFVHLPDRDLHTTRRKRYAWRFRCETCGHESKAKTRQGAKANEAAHREWHAHVQRVSMAGPL